MVIKNVLFYLQTVTSVQCVHSKPATVVGPESPDRLAGDANCYCSPTVLSLSSPPQHT